MRPIVLGIVILLSSPLEAAGPIAESVARQYAAPHPTTTTYSTRMRSPAMFWSGVAIVGIGTFVTVAGVTFEQSSDLSLEDPATRLGRDLAPCGTDPNRTPLPIADCKTNEGLLWTGAALAVGGGVLMLVGGQTIQIVDVSPRRVSFRIRF